MAHSAPRLSGGERGGKLSTTRHRAKSNAGTRRIGHSSATHQTANLCGKLHCASLPRPQGRVGHSISVMIQEDMKILEPRSDPSGARRSRREEYAKRHTTEENKTNVRQLTQGIKRSWI